MLPLLEPIFGARLAYPAIPERTPFPCWIADMQVMDQLVSQLHVSGVADIPAHLSANPQLLDAISDGVWVTAANAHAMDMFQSEHAALLGPIGYLLSSRETLANVVSSRCAGRDGHLEEVIINTCDGRRIRGLLHIAFSRSSESDTAVITMIDLAGLHGSSLADRFVTTLAHEVRQPLSVIASSAEASLRWLDRDRPDLAKAQLLAKRIITSVHRASDIIRSAQQTALGEATAFSLLDLNELVVAAADTLRHEAQQRGIELRLELSRGLSAIEGDWTKLQQVLINLLMNAMQSIDQAQAESPKVVTISTHPESGARLGVSIIDTGPGFDESVLSQAFARNVTTKAQGMGVGLMLCRSIVDSHSGEIRASNHPTAGAHLQISLPVADGQSTQS